VIFESSYNGRSGIGNGLNESRVAFATNILREATYFEGSLGQPLLRREALAALHQVVVSDYKYRPRDRVEFFAWLEDQDKKFLANLALQGSQSRQQMEQLEVRVAELDDARRERMQPFHRARQAYFNHIYENDYELELILDPVITIHPDEMSFEAFSRDESKYGRLAAKYELFDEVRSFACGTTNIDFSLGLHNELERLRTYRQTNFYRRSRWIYGGHQRRRSA
jgi:hypothetical protein